MGDDVETTEARAALLCNTDAYDAVVFSYRYLSELDTMVPVDYSTYRNNAVYLHQMQVCDDLVIAAQPKSTPLQLERAAKKGDVGVVRYLCRIRSRAGGLEADIQRALEVATKGGFGDVVKVLLELLPPESEAMLCVTSAVCFRHSDTHRGIAEMLLSHGGRPPRYPTFYRVRFGQGFARQRGARVAAPSSGEKLHGRRPGPWPWKLANIPRLQATCATNRKRAQDGRR
jgi:hypothetical protein